MGGSVKRSRIENGLAIILFFHFEESSKILQMIPQDSSIFDCVLPH